ncbi:alcohol dehydrogenase [Pseudonocardia sulfidoxydans NBRC 16205]|uniref:Alcohol dehydrogenase n=1 Tax=Pseudonocardia sulfidoxydans NBRC 16205 TaxID=1223511 RepID=A0A511DC82_9PSEU|nr:iron-containing alcohol dehydrogenase [Pseudonocardia sulfidoxydans]GEL22406.1 alcohol dehydrogenase [Pseudonocardia sulfidoxydans NBRC 16205]
MTIDSQLTHAVLRVPPLIHFGWGSAASVPGIVSGLGRRVLVCSDMNLIGQPDFALLHTTLVAAGCQVEIYSEGRPELPLSTIDAAVAAASRATPDVILGYGGGSSIDLAKIVALLLTHPGPVSRYYGENKVPGPLLPVVAVPTTAGTGSEVTPVAVVADPEREFKVGVSSPWLIPAAAVVDPALTRGCPTRVRAHSGADALAHSLEALTAGHRTPTWTVDLPVFVGSQRLGNSLALEAAASIGPNLRRVVADAANEPALTAMSYGSLCAGMAFGTSGTHLGHALQYSIGAATHTSHGLGVGLLLPYVLEATRPVCDDRLAQAAAAWGIEGPDPAGQVIDEVVAILAGAGIPRTLADIGLERRELPRLAEQAARFERLVANAPILADDEVLLAILHAAWSGDRPLARRR